MRELTTPYLSSILVAAEPPCVSIYLPTVRQYPQSQQNSLRFKNLVGTAEDALKQSYPPAAAGPITAKLRQLQNDDRFWNHTLDGVAVLASPERFDVFNLPRTMPERAEVGETFHVKPLIRHTQSADRFHVLGLSRERVALFEGNRYELTPLEAPGIPLTLTDALGEEVTEKHVDLHTTGPGPAQFHGQGGRETAVEIDTERFFRVVDRAVAERVSDPSGLPLVPVALDDNLSVFRAVAKNRHLTAEGVGGDWTNWSLPELRDRAWKVFEKQYLAELAKIRDDYATAAARRHGSADLSDAARAAVAGRVGILLIDADRTQPGAIDPATGELRPAAAGSAAAGDMFDDLAEIGLKNGATVIITPRANMPTDTGLAAIFRY